MMLTSRFQNELIVTKCHILSLSFTWSISVILQAAQAPVPTTLGVQDQWLSGWLQLLDLMEFTNFPHNIKMETGGMGGWPGAVAATTPPHSDKKVIQNPFMQWAVAINSVQGFYFTPQQPGPGTGSTPPSDLSGRSINIELECRSKLCGLVQNIFRVSLRISVAYISDYLWTIPFFSFQYLYF